MARNFQLSVGALLSQGCLYHRLAQDIYPSFLHRFPHDMQHIFQDISFFPLMACHFPKEVESFWKYLCSIVKYHFQILMFLGIGRPGMVR
ncbi:hypothetical protein BGC30_07585 [Novacetimonas hansenii]|nr:hypothetical protein BGC30_07585 [Novacetimonas hansenii]